MRLLITVGLVATLLSACAIKTPITNQYQLTAYSSTKLSQSPSHNTLLVTPPQAMDGYQTNQMQYTALPYALKSFTKNSWFSPPATMFYPLLIESLQHSNYFYAIGSGNYANQTDYQLDTQLIELQQNFIGKPSHIDFKVKVILSRVADNRIVSSKTFAQHIRCPEDTPYGGVIASNLASKAITGQITRFVVQSIQSSTLNTSSVADKKLLN